MHGAGAFGFMPPTFVLPAELEAWRASAASRRRGTPSPDGPPSGPRDGPSRKLDGLYIVKPNNASRSRGIRLVRADDENACDDGGDAGGAGGGAGGGLGTTQ